MSGLETKEYHSSMEDQIDDLIKQNKKQITDLWDNINTGIESSEMTKPLNIPQGIHDWDTDFPDQKLLNSFWSSWLSWYLNHYASLRMPSTMEKSLPASLAWRMGSIMKENDIKKEDLQTFGLTFYNTDKDHGVLLRIKAGGSLSHFFVPMGDDWKLSTRIENRSISEVSEAPEAPEISEDNVVDDIEYGDHEPETNWKKPYPITKKPAPSAPNVAEPLDIYIHEGYTLWDDFWDLAAADIESVLTHIATKKLRAKNTNDRGLQKRIDNKEKKWLMQSMMEDIVKGGSTIIKKTETEFVLKIGDEEYDMKYEPRLKFLLPAK